MSRARPQAPANPTDALARRDAGGHTGRLFMRRVGLLLFWQAATILKTIAAEDLETLKGLLYVADDGQVGLREDYHHHSDWKQVQERLLEILGPDGSILYRNERLGDRTLGGPPFAGEGERAIPDARRECPTAPASF